MRFRIFFLMGILAFASLAKAQVTQDAQLWKGLILEKKFFNNKLKVALNEEVRLTNNFSSVGNAFTDIIPEYCFTKSLSLGIGYRYAVKPEVNVHRVYSDFTWEPRLKTRIRFSVRTRYTHDMSPVEIVDKLRARFNLTYNIKGTKLEPHMGFEPFFNLNSLNSEFGNYRLTAGLRYPLRKKVELRAAYIWDQELNDPTPTLDHIFMLRVVVSLDKDSEKDDKDENVDPPGD